MNLSLTAVDELKTAMREDLAAVEAQIATTTEKIQSLSKQGKSFDTEMDSITTLTDKKNALKISIFYHIRVSPLLQSMINTINDQATEIAELKAKLNPQSGGSTGETTTG